MRCVRGRIDTLLAATLLTLAIGLQVLEATGRWDRTFEDSGDEAIVVTLVLCVGAALVMAAGRPPISLVAIETPLAGPLQELFDAPLLATWTDSSASPPLSLRV